MPDLTRVLLVDDNPKYLEDVLPFYGFELTCAVDGVQALKLLESNQYDLILLDVMMPNMNGWETLKAIRKNPPTQDVPVNSLTTREKDVLLLVTQGESNKSIADKLILSEITVKSHLNSIFKKLNVTNRTQAVLTAMQMNLVEK